MNIIVKFLEWAGKEFEKGLAFVVKEAVPIETLVAAIFPPATPVTVGLFDGLTLIQNAVLQAEQKYAAAGVQDGTGQQKAAEVLLVTQQAVTGLLNKDGITADANYVQNLINAVVGILNVRSITVAADKAAVAPGKVPPIIPIAPVIAPIGPS